LRKLITGAVALAACGALGLTGVASAGGGSGANTTVTIKGGGEISGTVKSPKPRRCAKGRKVIVYRQKGNQQNPSNDDKVTTDEAERNNGEYQWNAGNPGDGDYYARARKIDGCQGDFSRTVAY
jgi:hypothetical protein